MLYPAIAEAARRAGATAVGLIDVRCVAGFTLNVDRVGIRYSSGISLGARDSPVQVSCSLVGKMPVPAHELPEVVKRIGIDRDPIDVSDADETRWLLDCLAPDQMEQLARLEAEIALAQAAPPLLLRGDSLDLLPEAVARVPSDALAVVTTTWSLSSFSTEKRLRLLHILHEASTEHAVVLVSAEGVGVAPGVPTLGDRAASGHSIIGLTEFNRLGPQSSALGRCWGKGRILEWLGTSESA